MSSPNEGPTAGKGSLSFFREESCPFLPLWLGQGIKLRIGMASVKARFLSHFDLRFDSHFTHLYKVCITDEAEH